VNAPLYNQQILRLAANTPATRLAAPMASVEKRSPVCGSRVTVDVDVDSEGRVAAIGMLVRACALGQASATLMAADAVGKSPAELAATRDALAAWLAGRGPEPDWPGIDIFAPALPHSARHASIRLAFEAVAEAAAIAAEARQAAA
jgi:NifU-like protein involved in Fe-S cluster formation